MTSPLGVTPYSTIRPLFTPSRAPSWVHNPIDAERVQSYLTYDDIYWTVPDTFKLTLRGTDNRPIYVPSARTIIDTLNRYVGKGLKAVVSPDVGTPASQALARQAFASLFARERFRAKYAGAKLEGLRRGDWIFKVTANPDRPPGSRLSIYAVDPGEYFPIFDPDDIERRTGVVQAKQFLDPADANKPKIRVMRWLKDDVTGLITYDEAIYSLDRWDKAGAAPERVVTPLVALPAEITAIPVYHVRNTEETGNPFGSSRLRGVERLLASIDQSISDEDLALALEGIGMFATDAGAPVDSVTGEEVPWELGPGRVVEISPGSSFTRVSGIGSVTPYQDHVSFLTKAAREATGATDIAVGQVDVATAESGISLLIRLGPILSLAQDMNAGIADVASQMFYDLKAWHRAYEGLDFADVEILPAFDDPLPTDRKAKMAELSLAYNDRVISASYYRAEMTKLGYEFPPDIEATILAEQAALAQALVTPDPFDARLLAEAGIVMPTATPGPSSVTTPAVVPVPALSTAGAVPAVTPTPNGSQANVGG